MPSPRTFDHASDLSWVVGTITHVPLEGGFWELEFGDGDAPYGGRVVLGRPEQCRGLADGTWVRVTGSADPTRMSIFMAGTMYELATLEVLGDDGDEAGG